MKRRFFSILIACSLVVALAACGSPSSNGATTPNTDPGAVQTEPVVDDTPIEITFPAEMFEGVEINDLDAYAEGNDFISAAFNDDGSLTVTMTTTKHNQMLAAIKSNFEDQVEQLYSDHPYVKEITYDEDLADIKILVDPELYKDISTNIVPMILSSTIEQYQINAGEAPAYTFSTVDASTNQVLDSVSYPAN
ncbi:MAG: hypothetical protein AAGU12_13630 [Clostridiales bacterium]